MVRSYILTDREREILKLYITQSQLKLNGYRELKHLIGKLDIKRLEEDLALIKRFLEKAV